MTNPNEPAFSMIDGEANYMSQGLTRREYFAAMAMQALASIDNKGVNMEKVIELDSFLSVKYADALIKALNETP